ncbi:PhnD/SsuA/transferrin family substrate-binding protein [Nesterenkonia xinjiangensis]|nr:PhnD/SsuA/transferrin family substrate-binding protein [Nesterenkonia xinjiangensis]
MARRRSAATLTALLALSLTSLGLTACDSEAEAEAGSADASDPCPDTLRFSDTGVEGLETLVLEFEDFRVALEEATGKQVDFYPISSRTAAATALEFDEIDLLLTGPAEYVVLRQEAGALPVVGVTRPDYRAILVAGAGQGIESVADLEGGTVITKEVGSTSGHLGPLEMLVSAGLEPGVDVEVVPLDSTRIEAFASGEGDALGTGLKDFEEVEEEMGEGTVVLLEEGPDLPNDLFVARKGLGQDCTAWLQEELEENQDVLLEAIVQTGENDKYLESELVRAEDADYDPTRTAFEAAGFEQYSDLPDEDEQ